MHLAKGALCPPFLSPSNYTPMGGAVSASACTIGECAGRRKKKVPSLALPPHQMYEAGKSGGRLCAWLCELSLVSQVAEWRLLTPRQKMRQAEPPARGGAAPPSLGVRST